MGIWGRGLVLSGDRCQAEGHKIDEMGKMDERFICWARDFKVQILDMKVGSQEGFPAGYGL